MLKGLFACFLAFELVAGSGITQPGLHGSTPIPSSPLYFEPAHASEHPDVQYVATQTAYALELSSTAIDMRFMDGSTLRMNLPHAALEALEQLPGRSNYYIGTDPSQWRTNVPHYARVRYRMPFPGVDLLVYGKEAEVEYDWVVAPGVDPSAIRLSFSGAKEMRLDNHGDLVIKTSAGQVRHRRPRMYQDVNGIRRDVAGSFLLAENGSVGFRISGYDSRRPLVIDPQLVYAAVFGGRVDAVAGFARLTLFDTPQGIAVDLAGNTYVTGTAFSSSLPLIHPLQESCSVRHCIFVTKLSPDGKTILYSTYLTGPREPLAIPVGGWPFIVPAAIASDPDGNVYLTGTTDAGQLPQIGGGVAKSAGGNDAFVVKLDPNGVLKATMLIGGSGDDAGASIALGPDGFLYVAGITQSKDFPVSPGALRATVLGINNFFALKIDPKLLNGDTLASSVAFYSALLGTNSTINGGSASSIQARVAADATGSAYVAAYVECSSLNTTPGNLQAQCAAEPLKIVAAIVKINAAGTKLVYANFLGSGSELIGGFAVDAQGYAYVAGMAASADFPATRGAFRSSSTAPMNPFVAKLNQDGTGLVYATLLGGDGSESVSSLALDAAGNAYVAGSTQSSQFPTLGSLQSGFENEYCFGYYSGTFLAVIQNYCSLFAGFLSVVKPDGSGLVWSTLLGRGVPNATTVDVDGNVHLAGVHINPGAQPSNPPTGGDAISVLKIVPGGSPIPIDGIVNAASFHSGLPYSGGLASMFVHGLDLSDAITVASSIPLPTTLAGVSILVNGTPAPILAVANVGPAGVAGSQQINFQVPFEAPGNGSIARVELRYKGISSFAVPTRVAPGIFTLSDGSGAIQHGTDFSLVTHDHPAKKGEVIIVYVTGMGGVRPAVPTGAAATGPATVGFCYSPPVVSVGDILYAGITPGFPGLYQINVRVSPNAPSGDNNLNITWLDCWAHFSEISLVIPANDSKSNTVRLPVQ
jgi:uncharacterized protein (TIGR03437 family)